MTINSWDTLENSRVMGYEGSYAAICAQVNASFDIRSLIDYIGWYPEKLTRRGDVYSGFCPIHQDTIFRTLVLNPRKNTYHCEHGSCSGNYPADFLDLLVKVHHKSLPEVIQAAVSHFGPEYFRLTPRQIKVIENLVAEAQARTEKE